MTTICASRRTYGKSSTCHGRRCGPALYAAGVARAKKYDFAEAEAAVTKFGPPLGAVLRKRFVWLADISEEGLTTAVRLGAIKMMHEIGGDEYLRRGRHSARVDVVARVQGTATGAGASGAPEGFAGPAGSAP